MKVEFNEKRAIAVFKILDEQWRQKFGVFEGVVLPQNRWPLPMKTDQEKANFLFYSAIFMRGAIISEDPFRWLVSFWDALPNLYNPEFVISLKLEPDDIKTALTKISAKPWNGNNSEQSLSFNLYKIDQFTNSWINNSRLVVEKFNGNVLNIFKGVKDFEEAFSRIDYKRYKGNGLTGMRRKIFSLLTIWLQEKGLIPHFPTPIPVDFHAQRILWATEIISLPELEPFKINDRHPQSYEGKLVLRVGEEFINIITKWSQDFLYKIKISHLSINPALWVLSRELCVKNYQTTSKGRGTILIEPSELRQDSKLWPKRYQNPCSVCPIETFCTGAIPAAPYYIWGILMRLERISYPYPPPPIQGVLAGISEEQSIFHGKSSKRTKK